MHNKTYFSFTLGCKVNSYETVAINNILEKDGFVYDEISPSVVIINTCSVTHVADQKSRQHVRKFRNQYPDAILVVMGCFAQGNMDLLKEINANIILGTAHRSEILSLINQFDKNHVQITLDNESPRKYEYEELGVNAFGENVRCYLKIQDGCDNFCSYCIVPYRRGKSRSRAFEDVIIEATCITKRGYKEIILSGIHVGNYGKDINKSFTQLLKALLEIPNIPRIRISSIEMSEVDDELIELMGKSSKLCKHFHIPLQSGSNNILKRMGRRYSREEFIAKCKKIKSLCPDIALTSDVIVGFPGESEDDFLDTYNLIKEVGFMELHVFPYSKRSGTVAAEFKDQIAPNVKKDRSEKLLSLSKELKREYEQKFIGKELEILVEQYKTNYNIGRTSNYLEIIISSNIDLTGKILNKIIENNDYID